MACLDVCWGLPGPGFCPYSKRHDSLFRVLAIYDNSTQKITSFHIWVSAKKQYGPFIFFSISQEAHQAHPEHRLTPTQVNGEQGQAPVGIQCGCSPYSAPASTSGFHIFPSYPEWHKCNSKGHSFSMSVMKEALLNRHHQPNSGSCLALSCLLDFVWWNLKTSKIRFAKPPSYCLSHVPFQALPHAPGGWQQLQDTHSSFLSFVFFLQWLPCLYLIRGMFPVFVLNHSSYGNDYYHQAILK